MLPIFLMGWCVAEFLGGIIAVHIAGRGGGNIGYGVVENGQLRTMIVSIPVIIKMGKSKRWKGYKVVGFEERKMMMENSGYSELNDINWGYII